MGTQAKDGRGYGFVSVMSKMESVGIHNWPQSEAGNRKAMACPPAIHYDNSSTCLWLLEIEYAANATLDTSLKQGCQHVFLPYFSVCVGGDSQKLCLVCFRLSYCSTAAAANAK